MRCAILLACLAFAAPAAAQQPLRVVVAATVGLRGADTALGRAAAALDSLRRAHPDRVVAVEGGDLLAGSPFAAWAARTRRVPDPFVELLNLGAWDAVTPGPRDLALGAERLAAAYGEGRFGVASASVVREGGAPAFAPVTTVRRGPLRVAVTGVITGAGAPTGSLAARPLDAALAALRAARGEADVLVVVAHLAPAERARLDELRALADVVIPAEGRGPGALAVVELSATPGAGGRWAVTAGPLRDVPLAGFAEPARLAAQMGEARTAARAALALPLGRAAAEFPARLARAEPVPLLELVHRVQRRHTGARLSLAWAPPPGVRLAEGELRRADFAALDPDASPLRSVLVTGEQLVAILEGAAAAYDLDAAGRLRVDERAPFATIGGARYELDLARPRGRRVRELLVDGRYVIPTDTFTLAFPRARPPAQAAGAPLRVEGEEPLRELLAQEVERAEVLDPARYATAEWRLVPETVADDARRHWRGAVPVAGRAGGTLLRILSINDFHGALETLPQPDGTRLGGAAVLDAHMDSLAAECRCPTLRLDAGDALQGTLLSMADHGRTVLEAYRRMGIAAAAVGNHELDWGQDTLRARIRESGFPWLAANVVDSATGRRVPWIRSHAVVQAGELRVGVVGYVTRHTKRAVRAPHTAGLAIRHGAAALRDVLDSLRAARPDVVVLLAHEGGSCEGTSCRGDVFELAEELGRGAVDVIVSGHSHTVIADAAGAIPIVQAGSNARGVGVADVLVGPDGARRVEVRVVRADEAAVTPDSALAALVGQAARRHAAVASRVVGRLRVPMRRARGAESALGNFVADAYRVLARADVALVNRGGIRADLDAGPVTYAELFAVSPFGNRLLLLELTGAELEGLLERAAAEAPPGGYFYSGVALRYDPRRPRGERLAELRLGDGRKLDRKRTYRLVASDYVADNRETELRLFDRPRTDAGLDDLEALERWVRRQPQPIDPPPTGRLQVVP
jgi:2',3'-cyclic-nucleotide 2'-phosphodiesterase (5'-nucleotidase family)